MSSSTFNDLHLKSNFSSLESIFQGRFVYSKNDAIPRIKKRNSNIEILGNPEILILWQERNGAVDERMGELLQSIFRDARFRPAASHPNYAWWQRCWAGSERE